MSLSSIILSDIDAQFSDWGDYYTQGGQTVKGIFDNEYRATDLLTGEISSAKPAFVRKTADVQATVQGDTIVVTSELYAVSAISYTVISVENAPADLGPGLTRLVLMKA
jgi:hypothetical protein